VTAISPNVGSTDGTYFKITGTGFVGPRVTLGGVAISQAYSTDPTTIHVTAPSHAPGSLDVVVTNADGQVATAPGGFSYALPESFEVNGNWEGGADSNYETLLRFTIQGNTLTSASCGTSAMVTFSSPVPITRGTFSFLGSDGTSISGMILSANHAKGAISIPSCVNYPWFATKQP
jgi:IPT/TIG domain